MTVTPWLEVGAVAAAVVVTTWCVTYLLHSTALFVAVAAVVRCRPLSAANRVTMWRIALLVPFASTTAHTTGWMAAPLRHPDPATLFPAALIDWRAGIAVLCVCLLCAAHVVVRLVHDRRTLRRVFGGRTAAEPWLQDEALTLARGLDNVKPIVTVSQHAPVPAALGHREVCLPAQALIRWSDDERRAITAHELAHLERGDTRLFAWCVIATMMVPVQPLNWLVLRRMRQAAEQAADDRAVDVTGNAEALATALVSLVQYRHDPISMHGTAANGSSIVMRVSRLLEGESSGTRWPRRTRTALMATVFVVLAIAGPGLAVTPRAVVNRLPWLVPSPGVPHERLIELRHTSRAWRTALRETFR